MTVDTALVLASGASLPVYAVVMFQRWSSWHRYRDQRARREYLIGVLVALIALSVFVSVALTRGLGLATSDPFRIGAVAAMTATVLIAGVVLAFEWPDR